MLSHVPVHGLSHAGKKRLSRGVRKIEVTAIMHSPHVVCRWVKLSLDFLQGQGYLGFTASVQYVAGVYLY